MTTVTISLPESLKTFIDEQLATKGYGNVSEYFRSLLRAAQEREEEARLETLLVEGLTTGGDDIPLTREFWKDLKTEATDVAKKARAGKRVREIRYAAKCKGRYPAATGFLEAVNESIEPICKKPEISTPKQFKNPVLAGLASWAIKAFEDMLIFYVVQSDSLRVVRVLHGRRDIKKILEREKDDEKPSSFGHLKHIRH